MIHPDVAAMLDVLNDMCEETDAMSIEDAVFLRESVVELRQSAATLLGLIDTQLVTTLESPRVINGNLYEVRKSDGKWRPDHMPVDAAVRRAAMADENGEMHSVGVAVDEAVRIMADLYRAASTMPKIGALEKLGLKKYQVADQESGKPVLKVIAVAEAES